MTLFVRTAIVLFCAGSCYARPFLFYRGTVNSASLAPQGLASGAIARGSIFSVFGKDLGLAGGTIVSTFPLGTSLAGSSVEVCQGTQCVAAIPIFANAGQINAIMPSNAPLGPVTLRATFNSEAGNFTPAEVVASSFGIFAANSGGFGPGILQNFVAPDNQPINSLTTSVKRGQVVTLWGTGLGAGLNADNVAPQAGDLPVSVTIWVGGKRVSQKLYSGRSPCCSGVDQIVFEIPADAPLGCYVPVQVQTAGRVSNSVSIAITSDGAPCDDPWNPLSAMWRKGGPLGLVVGHRVNTILTSVAEEIETTVDLGMALFRREPGGPFAYQALASLPPPGACTVHAVRGDLLSGYPLPTFEPAPGDLDAGNLDFAGAAFPKPAGGIYYGLLAQTGTPPNLVLHAPVTVRGLGGPGVGAFSVQLAAAPSIRWTDRTAGNTIERERGFRASWEGEIAGRDAVLIAGFSTDVPRNSSAAFLCTAPAGATSFLVPPEIVQALPASQPGAAPAHSFGYAMVGVLRISRISAPAATGLGEGAAMTMSWSARTVVYR